MFGSVAYRNIHVYNPVMQENYKAKREYSLYIFPML